MQTVTFSLLISFVKTGLKVVLNQYKFVHKLKYRRLFSMDNRERGSHARGVNLTKDTSRM